MFNRAYIGICHKISPKHPDRYVGTFAGKHSMRSQDTMDQTRAIVAGMKFGPIHYMVPTDASGLSSGARS